MTRDLVATPAALALAALSRGPSARADSAWDPCAAEEDWREF
jgi:hypothetical protein